MAGALRPFNTCDTVLEYFKDQAPEYLIQRAGGGDMTTTTDQAGPPVRTRTAPQQGRAADSLGCRGVGGYARALENERARGRNR